MSQIENMIEAAIRRSHKATAEAVAEALAAAEARRLVAVAELAARVDRLEAARGGILASVQGGVRGVVVADGLALVPSQKEGA